ncbi:MAG: isoleucine--tRNA ligase [Planctomycetes bacterium]|nr:isoleucine--tRNA ligase [Planctomycetota bacterium]NOG55546.1 isoleucine--tRNA ligase [Planctomycetota bacterium]
MAGTSSEKAQQQGGKDSGGTADKPNYRKTLNLPQTSFPMRANLIQNEPQSQKRWERMDLYHRTREVRTDDGVTGNKGPWSFHDGPPYASGSLHLGHVLNKALKDFVVRTRGMMGYDVEFTPGWDCHGLPIEHRVMTEMHESGKGKKINELNDDDRRMAVRRSCVDSAKKFIKVQMRQMKQLLTLADYDKPYLTMQKAYESAVLGVFADLVAQGVVYRDLKPVHWSIANQTALAEAELEYEDVEDTSVFVNFEVEDEAQLWSVFGVTAQQAKEAGATKPAALMIWTTTPWTLPANLAVAVHARFRYALLVLDGRPVVVAEELAEKVATTGPGLAHLPEDAQDGNGAGTAFVPLAVCNGEDLLSVRYRHPFCDRVSPVVAADYVTLEDGTGLVHTAPGHGLEDYLTGLSNGLEIYCPVLEDGTFDETAPEWLHGKTVWEANPMVLERLDKSGHLYHEHRFTHSYPHDWRSKTPVIFRATKQWFIGVDKETKRDGKSLRQMALDITARDVAFFPEWGRNRMRGMLESRPDWCLSRQRAWGLPIPAFRMPDGTVVLTEQIVRAVAKAVGEHGSDLWFTKPAAEVLQYYDAAHDPEAPDGLDVNTLEKMYDIFDVWFESGSSWCDVMKDRGRGYPVDLYLEGSDQHRGWFQLSLLCGLGSTGTTPFKALLTHGFTVDKDGKKMSKSVGNTVEVDDLFKEFGADICRWWVAGLNFENDIKADHDYFTVAGEAYRKVRNTLRFLLSNLYDFEPSTSDNPDGHCVDLSAFPPHSLDAWVLSEYNALARKVMAAYKRYDFRTAQAALYDFCNVTLSAEYCAAVKDRLYCDKPDSARRRRTQTAMWELVEGLVRLLAPILPHTADEAYRALWKCDPKSDERCIHLMTFVESYSVSAAPEWEKVLALHDSVMKKIEEARAAKQFDNPLDAGVRVPDTAEGTLSAFAGAVAEYGEDFCGDLADLLGVSRVEIVDSGESLEVYSLADAPRCDRSWKRDGSVKQRADGGWLSGRDAEAVGVE